MRAALVLVGLVCFVRSVAAQPVLPAGFEDSLVASVPVPTALAFTPDGRLLIATQSGKLRIVRNGALLATPALDLAPVLCTDSERGLLGVAVDPAFATNRTIYLFYTFKKSGVCERNTSRAPVNRVARFVLSDANTVDRATEAVLIDNIPSPNGNHNAGDLQFGRDGFLYVSVGDGGCDYLGDSGCATANDAARDSNVLLGKILRITRDGAIPASNPHRGTNSVRCNVTGRAQSGQVCQEIFATGLRNPFRMAFDPNASGTRFFINDVGQNAWEEIDLGQAGADYGWNIREGRCANGSTTDCGSPPAGLTDPIFAYSHSAGCTSITGGAFVPNGRWGAAYDSGYLFSDYVCGTVFLLKPQSNGTYARSTFASGLGGSSAVALLFGPHDGGTALYYTTYANGGQVRRIARTGNAAPDAVLSASPLSGAPPLTVRFDGSASRDPDGDNLTFAWDFGDGTGPAPGATVSHTYSTAGLYTARLTVTDARGASAMATVQISVGNRPPQPTISSPSSSTRFSVGQTITLQGSATDPEDGVLPGTSLTWRVILHHGTHTHPFLGPVSGSSATFQAPAPEDLAATTNSYLEIELTATDRVGVRTRVTQNLLPALVSVTFATQPSGLSLAVNGTTITAPRQVTSWHNYQLRVNAADQVDTGGVRQIFLAWSDGGAAAHTIVTPASAATYTATFGPGTMMPASADSFVRGGAYAARNFGTAAALEVKTSSSVDLTRHAYVKFNISGVASVGAARLRVYGALSGTETNVPIAAWRVPDTTWSETAITWNNRPSPSTALTTVRIADTTPRWYDFDVTAHAREARAAGRQSLTLALIGAGNSSAFPRFNSRESAANRPQLVVAASGSGASEIVLYAAEATVAAGAWRRVADTTAAGGARMSESDAGRAKVTEAAETPSSYFEMTFDAEAGRPYRLWMRGKAANNYWGNDSVFVQFSSSVTGSATPIFRIGTHSAATYILEDCNGCGLSGWGWQDNGWGTNVLGPEIYFAATGRQTIRIQTREDGLSIDQIVLSPAAYRTKAPGSMKNDTTILPK